MDILEEDVVVESTPEEVVRKLNCLCDELAAGAYKPGARNNIAVDLAILCYELCVDPREVAEMAWENQPIQDADDLDDRLSTIEDYLATWDAWNIESYMLGDWGCEDGPKKEWIRLV